MLLMKLALYFQAFTGYISVALVRFILTIIWGPDEALCRAQAATVKWAEENQEGLAAFARLFQSPVRVTIPTPDVPDASSDALYMSRAIPAPAGDVQAKVDFLVGAPVAEFFLWSSQINGDEISHVTLRTEHGCLDLSAATLGVGLWGPGAIEEGAA